MSFSKKLFCFLVLISLFFNLPSYAGDINKDLDKECKDFCTNNDFDDGYYLAPEPDVVCKEGYDKNEICCCKPKAET